MPQICVCCHIASLPLEKYFIGVDNSWIGGTTVSNGLNDCINYILSIISYYSGDTVIIIGCFLSVKWRIDFLIDYPPHSRHSLCDISRPSPTKHPPPIISGFMSFVTVSLNILYPEVP